MGCSEQSAAPEPDTGLTGERFFDAVATKLMSATPSMTRDVANCMVSAMTADGKIGVGEINQAKLDSDGVPSRQTLRTAFLAAAAKCK